MFRFFASMYAVKISGVVQGVLFFFFKQGKFFNFGSNKIFEVQKFKRKILHR